MSEYRILGVRMGCAILSTRGKRRVVIRPSGRIIAEMTPAKRAQRIADTFNACSLNGRAIVESYRAG